MRELSRLAERVRDSTGFVQSRSVFGQHGVSAEGIQLKHSAGIRCLCRVLCINHSFL